MLTTLAIAALFWELFAARQDVIWDLSIATASPALLLTAAVLLEGPWNLLRGHNNPVSFDLQRDLGIWAGIMALLPNSIHYSRSFPSPMQRAIRMRVDGAAR
jgi:methionine sulfoxide reductase heme-binding subunit